MNSHNNLNYIAQLHLIRRCRFDDIDSETQLSAYSNQQIKRFHGDAIFFDTPGSPQDRPSRDSHSSSLTTAAHAHERMRIPDRVQEQREREQKTCQPLAQFTGTIGRRNNAASTTHTRSQQHKLLYAVGVRVCCADGCNRASHHHHHHHHNAGTPVACDTDIHQTCTLTLGSRARDVCIARGVMRLPSTALRCGARVCACVRMCLTSLREMHARMWPGNCARVRVCVCVCCVMRGPRTP